MRCLVDTNVLLRSVQLSHPMNSAAAGSIASLLKSGEELFITPQNVVEFWCVATRPESANGLGLDISDTTRKIGAFRAALAFLPDTQAIFDQWEPLVFTYEVIGKRVYDARLVAAMLVHGVSHLLTFNDRDFKRFNEITVVNPQSIIRE
jgi:predicted nucleic acid-binding protein